MALPVLSNTGGGDPNPAKLFERGITYIIWMLMQYPYQETIIPAIDYSPLCQLNLEFERYACLNSM